MAPDDFATIYDVTPLYQAGVDGTGQKIVVVCQTCFLCRRFPKLCVGHLVGNGMKLLPGSDSLPSFLEHSI
jgi:hypothetical protein